jgi:pimeloyl-ACP methyl ester carboxylesterase
MVTRGTYPSDPPANDSDMSSTDMAHDLELLRKWLGLEQLRLYGHSIGGTIILGYAEFYPECVSSLVLVDSKMLDYDDTLTLMEFVTNRYTDPRYTNSIAALMISANFSNPAYPENDSAYRELLLQLLPWYFSNPELYEPSFASLVRSVPPPQNWATVVHDKCNIRNPTPNKALLGEVKAPTLIIVGEDDAFCTKVVAEIMHAGIKGSELVVYEDCGHLPWIERKEDFVEKMKDWWVKH